MLRSIQVGQTGLLNFAPQIAGRVRFSTMNENPKVVHCRMAQFDVYIGRPSKWGNPFIIGQDGDRALVIKKFKHYLIHSPKLMAALPELKGKTLGCYCAPRACHGDVLLELANERKS